MNKKNKIVDLWKQGKTNKAIANELKISSRTVSQILNETPDYIQHQKEIRQAIERSQLKIFQEWKSQKRKNLSKIARNFGLSRQRIHQILSKFKEYNFE